MALALSPTGAKALIELEGEVLTAYQDSAGIWTIGIGVTDSAYAFPGNTITKKKSRELFKREVDRTVEGVSKLVKVPLTEQQASATILFAYNIGLTAFKNSTFLKKLNKGDYFGAADQLLLWDKATVNGKKVVLTGLKKRRAMERAMFLSGMRDQETEDEFESNIEPTPLERSVSLREPQTLVPAGLVATGSLTELTGSLEPFAEHSETIRYVWLALGLLVVLLTIWYSRKED